MTPSELPSALNALRDEAYRAFQVRLIPNIDPDTVLGVRTPRLRALARELTDAETFVRTLPHRTFEENQIHSFLIAAGRDFDTALRETERFLPYIDNWAVCDQLCPRAFGQHRDKLLPHIMSWLRAEHPYTVRFGMKMLMTHYLDDAFSPEYPAQIAMIRHDDYYVKMMAAWYFATALAKRYDEILPFFAEHRLEAWVHNKAIVKACKSFLVPDAHKAALRAYRIR